MDSEKWIPYNIVEYKRFGNKWKEPELNKPNMDLSLFKVGDGIFISVLISFQRTNHLIQILCYKQDETQGQFLGGVQLIWIQSFPSPPLVTLLKLKKASLPSNLSIAGKRADRWRLFPRALVWSEIQTALSRIWTQVAISIMTTITLSMSPNKYCSQLNQQGKKKHLRLVKRPSLILHHHVAPSARISLTLSRHPSLSSIASCRSSGIHPVHEGVHRSTSLMSSSLFLQQCPARLVRLTWIVFVMDGRWPYSCCFERCCLQDLFNIACSIFV